MLFIYLNTKLPIKQQAMGATLEVLYHRIIQATVPVEDVLLCSLFQHFENKC